MKQLHNVMKDILETGVVKEDRTGTGTISKFGGAMRYDLTDGQWPIPTSRKVAWMKIAEELEWMIKGLISVQWLNDRNNKIWDSWVGQDGTIGPMYGEQWRNWNAVGGLTKEILGEFLDEVVDRTVVDFDEFIAGTAQAKIKESFFNKIDEFTKPYEQGGRGGFDQLQYIVDELKARPESRRLCVNVWSGNLLPKAGMTPSENVDAGKMALAPCHSMWQVNTQPISDLVMLQRWVVANHKLDRDGSDENFINVTLVEMNLAEYSAGVGNTAPWDEQKEVLVATAFGKQTADGLRKNGEASHHLSLLCFARSQDVPLGTVYNVGMYSLLTHLLASLTNMVPNEYIHFMGDYHIYSNQVDVVKEQLKREPMKMPRVLIDPTLTKIDDFEAKNLIVDYQSHPALVFPKAAV